jgi:hypothetical protein
MSIYLFLLLFKMFLYYKMNLDSYYIILCILLFLIYLFGSYTINKDNVVYEPMYKNIFIFLCTILSILLIILLSHYYKETSDFGPLKNIIFILSAIFLLYFGITTIREDEVVPNAKNKEIVRLNNDDISIYSILIGFLVIFLEFSRFVFLF